jgi:hypothetical protein
MLVYAIAKAIKSGILPKNPDWFKWSFNMPQKISIDAGRDSAAYQNEYKLGARNLTEWLAERGKSIEDHYRERAVEIVARKRIQEEVEKATGIEIDDREMQMLNPNEMPEQEEDNKDVTTDS